ncbi:MAG: hypothetical protein GTN99_07370, partial [Candidatus Dadabacteria bacterium]|nr:hypothetical protein [Candidatus Dadabacteria bacterium]
MFFGSSDVEDIDLSVDTSDVVTIEGELSDEFGVSVGGDGDYDGDPEEDEDFGDINRTVNRDDVLIGAPGFGGEIGRVFFYCGFDIEDAFEMGTNPTASKIITGLVPGGRFGDEIRDLGDINPDLDPEDR